jgi:uncharacterized membrane protein YvbJ
MQYCSQCGHKIEIEAAYCPKCGNVLEKEPVKKEPVRASEQDSQQTSDSNEVRAIQFDMKLARRNEILWSILSALFVIGGIPFFFIGMGSSESWFCLVLFIIGILCAVPSTIYNSKYKKCKKELIRLGASPK